MAKNTKAEKENTAAPTTDEAVAPATDEAVTPVAPVAPVVAMSASDELAELTKAFKAKEKELKAVAKTETKSAAIDLVTDAAKVIREDLVVAVGMRGLRINSFAIRYIFKDGDNQPSPTVGVVRMGKDEAVAFGVKYATQIAAAKLAAVITDALPDEADEAADDSADVSAD